MLNAQQSEAAKAESGFSLILAGAGTGKTTTLVEKVGAVIRSGIVLPAQIMLLTFSRAAAEEMKSRIAKKLPEAESITAGTFHSVALSILRRFCPEWSLLRNFSGTPSVIDEDKQNGILFDLAKDRLDDFFGIPVGTIVWLCTPINRRKGSSFHGFSLIEEALDGLLADYERFKSEHALADLSDLIRDCCLLIRESPSVRAQASRHCCSSSAKRSPAAFFSQSATAVSPPRKRMARPRAAMRGCAARRSMASVMAAISCSKSSS